MDVNAGDSHPLRVVLWSVPRSLSTVFEKCISFLPNTQVIIQRTLFYCFPLGTRDAGSRLTNQADLEQRRRGEILHRSAAKCQEHDLPLAFDKNECTYQFVKDELEADYPNKNIVFCKDMAYALDARYDMLPEGYRHTFIIRHPIRVFLSYKKHMTNVMAFFGMKEFRLCDLPPPISSKHYAFQEQYELMQYVKKNCKEEPIIIDADDLLTNPNSIMKQYCNLLGIEFKEEMLEWPSGFIDVVKSWKGCRETLIGNLHETGGYYDTALKSTRFYPLKEMPSREDLSEDSLVCADHSMPFYEKNVRIEAETII